MSDGLNISAISTKNALRKISAIHELKLEGAAPPNPLDSTAPITPTHELQMMKTEMEKIGEALQMSEEIYREIEQAYLSLFQGFEEK